MLKQTREDRLEKLKKYKERFEPYPGLVERSFEIKEVQENFSKFQRNKRPLSLVGRLKSIRDQGRILFLDLEDETGTFQVVLNKNKTEFFDLLKQTLDSGDFLSVKGVLFKTKTKEKSLEAKQARIISKSLRPLPKKWFGLKDAEKRFRSRELDLLVNKETKTKLYLRFEIIKEIRNMLCQYGFKEVETPILQPLYGGAKAKPFVSQWLSLKEKVYLRIAPELYLKRLLVAGFEKIFELGKNFRNEGISRSHYPEFTMLELYCAYKDYKFLMKFTKDFLLGLFKKFGFAKEIIYQGKKVNLRIWQTFTFEKVVSEYGNSGDEDEILKKQVRPKLIDPTFIIDYPKNISPLAKAKPENNHLTERFQLFIAGLELVNGFSELNDPVEQTKRLSDQNLPFDKEFIKAMEYGMPPAAGLGMGIDRLITLMTDSHSIREIISFPMLRSKTNTT